MIYLSDSPIIPVGCYGTYTYQLASIVDLKAVLDGNAGEWEVAFAYPRTCDLIHHWTGISLHDYESPTLDMWESLRLAHGDEVLLVRYSRRVILRSFTNPDQMMEQLLSRIEEPTTDVWMRMDDWELSWVRFAHHEPERGHTDHQAAER